MDVPRDGDAVTLPAGFFKPGFPFEAFTLARLSRITSALA
jgi:hypothetical protein